MAFIKRDFIKAFELLLNTLEAEKIQEFFGQGTQIIIRDIVFSPVKKKCVVDCVVKYGKDLETLEAPDDKFVRYLVWQTAELIISDYSVNVMVSYDA